MVPLFASECLLINAPLCQKNFNASTLWIYAKSSKFFACYGRVGKDIDFSIKFLSEIFKLALITSTIGCSNHGIKTFHNGSILQKHHGGPVHKITEDDSHFQLCGRHDHVSKMTMLVRWSYENRKFIGTNFGFHFPWADIQIVGWSISSTKTIDQSNLNTNLEKEPLLTLFRLLIVPLNNHGTEVYRLMVGGIRVWWVWRVQECGAWIYPARES